MPRGTHRCPTPVARGELRPGTDPDLIVDLVLGAAWYRFMLGHRPLTPEVADALVDALLVECQSST